MISGAPLYLHIGLPKTGTTFLQNQIFPDIPSMALLVKPEGDLVQGHPDPPYGLLDRCFKRSATIWKEFGDDIFDHLDRQLIHQGGATRVLLSDEGIGTLARKPHFLRIHLEEFSKKAMARGARSVKVICSFRRQDQWLGSHYAQRSHRAAGASQDDFRRFVEDFLHPGKGYFWSGVMLDYKTLRDNLVAGVGSENVLMQPYESLTEDRFAYLSTLLGFLGFADSADLARSFGDGNGSARANARSLDTDRWKIRIIAPGGAEGSRRLGDRILRRIGIARFRSKSPSRAGSDGEIRMTESLRRKVLTRYEKGNAALAVDLDLDLARYDYISRHHRLRS